jgi:hypothetical protein
MQPRNIEVFDGLRITTEHFDHLQGSIHSALADLRGIAGLARVHRGFDVSRIDAHAVQVAPGLAFDRQGRRVVSDEPVRLETPAAIASAPHFVCVAYDQGADGEVEGRPTRIWDSALIDIRPALPGPNEDAIVLAELRPAQGDEGFTVHADTGTAAPPVPVETTPAPPESASEVAPSLTPAARLGIAQFAAAEIDPQLIARLTSAVRARAATPGEGSLFTERLGSAEALAGFAILSVATDATARMMLTLAAGSPEAPPSAIWRLDASGHGQAVAAADGSISQFGAGLSALSGPAGQGRCAAGSFTDTGILRSAVADAPRTNGDALLHAFLGGFGFTLRLMPRNGDGFGIDAIMDWNGPPSEEIATWIEQNAEHLTWQARVGWTASGHMIAPAPGAPSGEG